MMAASTLRPLILICDDELPLRELIKAALGDRYRYVEAADADEADEKFSAENPEAIVLDVMLPGRSGIEFLTELRAGSEAADDSGRRSVRLAERRRREGSLRSRSRRVRRETVRPGGSRHPC